jgi:hypothetical protein
MAQNLTLAKAKTWNNLLQRGIQIKVMQISLGHFTLPDSGRNK